MDALPQVGQKYQHKTMGEVLVTHVQKRGRGYRIGVDLGPSMGNVTDHHWFRLKDFVKEFK